jgi:hypothetical protein
MEIQNLPLTLNYRFQAALLIAFLMLILVWYW